MTASSNPAATRVSERDRRLAECFDRGIHLATVEKNFEYAHAMFAECVLNDPGNLRFVEAMVQNLRAKSPRSRKSIFKLYRGGSRALRKALQQQEWPNVIRMGIELLKDVPWDVATLQAIANACEALHHNETELVYLKQALDSQPKSIEVNRHCARSLGRMGQFDQAIACWHRVEKLAGKSAEASQMIAMLAEEKLRYPKGRPPTVQTKSAPVEVEIKTEPEAIEDITLSPEQKLERAISQNHQNAENYLELVAILLEANRFNAAEGLLNRAIAACGEQKALVDQLNRVLYLRAEEQRRLDEERVRKQEDENSPLRVPWLEIGLAAAMLMLVIQLIPSVRAIAWSVVDFRHWSHVGWIVFNLFVLLGLIAVRFGPELRALVWQRRVRRKTV